MSPKTILTTLSALALGFFAAACTNGSGSSEPDGINYNGPGSAWSVLLTEDGDFQIKAREALEDDPFLRVEGTYERYDNGFIELTVGSASGTDAPSRGDKGMAIEAPGFAFLLRPLGGSGELYPMVTAGDCPDEDFTANWMMMTCNDAGDSCGASSTGRDFFGVFNYDESTETASLPARYALQSATSQGSNSIGTASCRKGVMEVSDALMYLTENQGAIVQISPDDHDDARHVMALPQETIVQTDLAGTYVGMGFDKSDDSSFAVSMTMNAGGTAATIYAVDDNDLEDATPGSAGGSIAVTSVNMIGAASANGWFTGTFTATGEAARPLYCTAAADVGDSGKNMLLCIGQSPGDADEFYNLVLVSEG